MRHHVTDDNLHNNKNKQHLVKVYLAPERSEGGYTESLYRVKQSHFAAKTTHFTTKNIQI